MDTIIWLCIKFDTEHLFIDYKNGWLHYRIYGTYLNYSRTVNDVLVLLRCSLTYEIILSLR